MKPKPGMDIVVLLCSDSSNVYIKDISDCISNNDIIPQLRVSTVASYRLTVVLSPTGSVSRFPILICCSAKPLLGHHALVWMDGWFQGGWLCVIWKWNKSVYAWEYWIRVWWIHEENNRSRGVDGDRGGGVCCLLSLKGEVVRLISCNAPLKASRL